MPARNRETAETLLRYAASDAGRWPLSRERPILDKVNTWVAVREGDTELLKRIAGWTDLKRRYRHDPLGERIADAWAAALVGEDPRTMPGNPDDVELMEELLGRDFPSELERAVGLSSSEGEIWGRIYTDPVVAPRPLLDWVSRSSILPLWQGSRLAAAAVVTELGDLGLSYNGGKAVVRHFEVHAPGVVVNAVYVGGPDKLGDRLPDVQATEPTADLLEEWDHGLPGLLVERIPNRLRRDKRIGVSDYQGILDYLLDLDEAVSIGAANMRLTARQRAIISASVAAAHDASRFGDGTLTPEEPASTVPRARFDPSEEVFVEDPLDDELGKSRDPVRILSYSFDADALIKWKRELVESAVTRAGLIPATVGVTGDNEGYAISGTAIRLRFLPQTAVANAKGRYLDDALPRILRTMALVDTLPQAAGGFARAWADPTILPTVERGNPVPEDESERDQRHATLVTVGLLSVETSIRERYPEWDDAKVLEEVDRIRADKAAAAPVSLGGF